MRRRQPQRADGADQVASNEGEIARRSVTLCAGLMGEMPRSAWARAAASLTSVAHHRDHCSRVLELPHDLDLVAREDLGVDVLGDDPDSGGDGRGVRRLSPVSRIGRKPSAWSRSIAADGTGFDRPTASAPITSLSRRTKATVRPSASQSLIRGR
ncbi:MAG: hypothetical protein R2705_19855 [Ilumatobacteraceae bacterium]